jgi:metallo-beta-lactamase family protein
VEIRADIECLTGLSAHADAADFQWWFGELGKRGGCGKAVVVHSEEGPAAATAALLADVCDEPPIVPKPGEVVEF